MPTPSEARLSLRRMVRDISAQLSVARSTGEVAGFVESVKELDAAWKGRHEEFATAELVGMKVEMSNLFVELSGLIEETASRHADVAMRPRFFRAATHRQRFTAAPDAEVSPTAAVGHSRRRAGCAP